MSDAENPPTLRFLWKRGRDLDTQRDHELPPEPTWPGRIVRLLRRNVPLVVLDLVVVVVAYLGPLVLRFDGAVPPRYWQNFWTFIPVVGFLHLMANTFFGLYGQMWRYASVREARQVVLSGVSAGLLVLAFDAYLGGELRIIPLSVVGMGAILALMGFGAIRFQTRLFAFRRRTVEAERSRVLLVGAGDAGAMVIRDIIRNDHLGLQPVAIIDDDPRKVGLTLNGIPVVGTRSSIPTLVEELQIDQVLLAIPSATSEVVRHMAALCEEANVTLRVLPSVREVVGGRVTARDIRDLRIEDLLGRQQVETDLEAEAGILRGRRVMILGAGGSIGAEIARQVAELGASGLILVDHDETHLHDVASDMDGRQGVESVLLDVRRREELISAFVKHRPQVVFHAAAHKHVPILEAHPEEALRTNVIGTANAADAALVAGVERFVLVSTDKAVKPTTVMGASKWLAEQVVRSLQGSRCVFCAVRFGNVLGSRGSVIPTFFRQIARGGPVTVTDPAMTRYFMSVQEAVQLVLQAAALSRGGEVFTLDMGEPVNIRALAERLIRLSGRVPNRDVEISIVGPRPGEKLSEDVLDPEEQPAPSNHPSITVSRPAPPDRAALRAAIRDLERLALEGRGDELAGRMKAFTREGLVSVSRGDVA